MPKQEVGSTKWLGNKMKAKGLQKLRWYCQMCQKQCRDENGFKCHRMSDGHQRQMQIFVQDPNKFMDEFSQEFQEGFMALMSHSYRSTRVLANTVYCDFISNRHHTHMNSTIWVTLSNFVQYLGRTNQCTIDKTPKGWYIQYIDNTPEARLRAQLAAENQTREVVEEERAEKLLRDQIEAGKAEGGYKESEFTELQREEGDAPISFSMGAGSRSAAAAASSSSSSACKASEKEQLLERMGLPKGKAGLEQAFTVGGSSSSAAGPSLDPTEPREVKDKDGGTKESKVRKLSAMERVRLEHEASKRQKTVAAAKPPQPLEEEGSQPWLAAGLIVKVMHQRLGEGKYYKKKAKIEKVYDRYAADVRMVDSGDLLRLEQELLETVIPNIGKLVRVVKGSHKGSRATMQGIDIEGFCVSVELEDGTIMEGLGYDEVCKIDG